jgi:hypothetical protein
VKFIKSDDPYLVDEDSVNIRLYLNLNNKGESIVEIKIRKITFSLNTRLDNVRNTIYNRC